MRARVKEKIGKYLTHLFIKRKRNFIDRVLIAIFSIYKTLKSVLVESDNEKISKIYLISKSLKRNIIGGKYRFVTLNELVAWTNEWLKSFPTTYDIIVGIPRSGLLVASIIALKLGKPITTPELFIKDHVWMSKLMDKKGEYKNILLIDDSLTSGGSMKESFQLLCSHCKNINITKAVLIVTEKSKDLVDLYYKIIPHPRLFEWNLAHAKKEKLASDMDGVICENCPPGVDSDEELYINWIKKAKPYLIPTFEIDIILSNRLEKYRTKTEEWLAKHGVRYKELILWNINSKQERKGKYAQNKIEVLLRKKPDIMWESSFSQSNQIWKTTKIPVLCFDEMIFFGIRESKNS